MPAVLRVAFFIRAFLLLAFFVAVFVAVFFVVVFFVLVFFLLELVVAAGRRPVVPVVFLRLFFLFRSVVMADWDWGFVFWLAFLVAFRFGVGEVDLAFTVFRLRG